MSNFYDDFDDFSSKRDKHRTISRSEQRRIKIQSQRNEWNCSCGEKEITGIVCPSCGKMKPVPNNK